MILLAKIFSDFLYAKSMTKFGQMIFLLVACFAQDVNQNVGQIPSGKLTKIARK